MRWARCVLGRIASAASKPSMVPGTYRRKVGGQPSVVGGRRSAPTLRFGVPGAFSAAKRRGRSAARADLPVLVACCLRERLGEGGKALPERGFG